MVREGWGTGRGAEGYGNIGGGGRGQVHAGEAALLRRSERVDVPSHGQGALQHVF